MLPRRNRVSHYSLASGKKQYGILIMIVPIMVTPCNFQTFVFQRFHIKYRVVILYLNNQEWDEHALNVTVIVNTMTSVAISGWKEMVTLDAKTVWATCVQLVNVSLRRKINWTCTSKFIALGTWHVLCVVIVAFVLEQMRFSMSKADFAAAVGEVKMPGNRFITLLCSKLKCVVIWRRHPCWPMVDMRTIVLCQTFHMSVVIATKRFVNSVSSCSIKIRSMETMASAVLWRTTENAETRFKKWIP